MKKIDWKKIVNEIPEEEQYRLAKEKVKRCKSKYHSNKFVDCSDGFVETWRKKFIYKGIAFELAILRYYVSGKGFQPIVPEKICDRHVVVEYPKETKRLVDDLVSVGITWFLWHDTLHTWNDKQNLEEQLQYAYDLAIKDIDSLPKMIDDKIEEFEHMISKLRDIKKINKLKRIKKKLGGKR